METQSEFRIMVDPKGKIPKNMFVTDRFSVRDLNPPLPPKQFKYDREDRSIISFFHDRRRRERFASSDVFVTFVRNEFEMASESGFGKRTERMENSRQRRFSEIFGSAQVRVSG